MALGVSSLTTLATSIEIYLKLRHMMTLKLNVDAY